MADISKKVTMGFLLKFALPTIITMLLFGTLGVVDSVFVSNILGEASLAAVGIAWPFVGFAMSFGFMIGIGGNALVGKKLGEDKKLEAKQNFTLITIVAFVVSALLASIGLIFPDFILNLLGADDMIRPMTMEYFRPFLFFMPSIVLSVVFQQFLVTEGKAHIATITMAVGAVVNITLNYLVLYVWGWGLLGTAIVSGIVYTMPAVVGLVYFTFARKGSLYFVKPKWDIRALGRSSINGASEMVTMLASSITMTIMNNILMRNHGFESVAAAGVIFAGMNILAGIFIGYSSGVAPIFSYNYGKNRIGNIKRIYRFSLKILGGIALFTIALGWFTINPIIAIFGIEQGTDIHQMAQLGFRIVSAGFIFMAYNSFASIMFTALNNAVVSSLLVLLRTLVFVVVAFLTLPNIFGLNGVWMAMPAAEILAIFTTIFFFKKMRKRYRYA